MAHDKLLDRIAERFNQIACPKCRQAIDVSAVEPFTSINCPSCGTTQAVPVRLSNFLLIGRLGSGGMASVFEAYDQSLGRRVAIKLMHTEMGEDPDFLDGFLREARAAAQLNHPNVVQIYQVSQEKGVPFIVMELLKGGRLDESTNAGRKLDELQVLDIALDVTKGLMAADAIRLVHGDIKPANILFDKKGISKVADFGLAKYQGRQTPGKNEVWGTPYYIAPEKIRKQPEDARSDIYSLGATLYHALAGHPPFEGEDSQAVVMARLQDLPAPLTEYRQDLATETVMLISRMLEPDPARRYPTYSSLLSDIQGAIKAVKNLPSSVRQTTGGLKKSSLGLYIGAGVAVLALAVGVIVSQSGRKEKKTEPPKWPDRNPPAGADSPPVKPGKVVAVQPFSVGDEKAVLEGFALLTQGKNKEAVAAWLDWVKTAKPDHPGRPWLIVLHALPAFMDRDFAAVDSRTRPLREKTFEPKADGSPDPAVLPQAIARFMATKQWTDPPAHPKGDWPAWYDHVAASVKALGLLAQKKMVEGRAALNVCAKRDWTGSPAWAAGFKSVVDYYLKAFSDWDRHNKDGGALLKAQKHREALELVVKARGAQPRALYLNYRKMVAEACAALSKKPGPPIRNITADSDDLGDEARNAIDGNPKTKWHTAWQKKESPYPHHLVIEFEKPVSPVAFFYLARQDPPTTHGMVREFAIHLSADGTQWGEPVARGSFDDQREMDAVLIPRPSQPVRFLKFAALSSIDGKKYACAAEVRVLTE